LGNCERAGKRASEHEGQGRKSGEVRFHPSSHCKLQAG
jgi:hypothetical protein